MARRRVGRNAMRAAAERVRGKSSGRVPAPRRPAASGTGRAAAAPKQKGKGTMVGLIAAGVVVGLGVFFYALPVAKDAAKTASKAAEDASARKKIMGKYTWMGSPVEIRPGSWTWDGETTKWVWARGNHIRPYYNGKPGGLYWRVSVFGNGNAQLDCYEEIIDGSLRRANLAPKPLARVR